MIKQESYDRRFWLILGLVLISSTGCVLSWAATGEVWVQHTAAAAFSERHLHSTVVFNNRIWVIAGHVGGGVTLNDVWYSTDGSNWTVATNEAAFSKRRGHTSVVFDNKMWVIGGWTGSARLNDVWYSSNGTDWYQATANAGFAARDLHASVVYDNKMWVINGWSGSGRYGDVWYSSDGANWTRATQVANFPARSRHRATVFDGKMWVTAGGTVSGKANDVWNSTDGITWTQVTANAAWDGRDDPEFTVFDNAIWVLGGQITSGARPSDVWRSTDGQNWTLVTENGATPGRSGHSCDVYQNRLWVIGGYLTGGASINDVWSAGVAPDPPIVSGDDSVSANPRPSWSWASGGGGNGTFRYQLDNESGDWTITTDTSWSPSEDLPVGRHTLYVQEQNDTGNWSASGCFVVIVAQGLSSIDDLQRIGNDPAYPLDGDYALTQDIDASATAQWKDGEGFNPIGAYNPDDPSVSFTGQFDGHHFTISGLTIQRPFESETGLFRAIRQDGHIRNLLLANASITGLDRVGAIVGINHGGSLTNCQVSGTVQGNCLTGGMVGQNIEGFLTDCITAVNVTGASNSTGGMIGLDVTGVISNSESSGLVTCLDPDTGNTGGLIGYAQYSIITQCSSSATVQGILDHVGGLVGTSFGGVVIYCEASGSTSGSSNVGGLIGYNLVGVAQQSYATGSVFATGAAAGGLIGNNFGPVTECYANGPVTGTDNLGGLAGVNEGVILCCYATGHVAEIVKAGIGGLVGSGEGDVIDSFWDTISSGMDASVGGTGKTTLEMFQQELYTNAGWDFDNVWYMEPGGSYPYLRALPVSASGQLYIHIEPQYVRDAGALWSIDDGQTWHMSGENLILPEGSYTAIFSDISGWTKPNPIQVEVFTRQITEGVGFYTEGGVINPVWVSFTEGSDNGPGIWGSPFRLLTQAWTAALDGGVIIMMADEPLEAPLRLGDDGKQVSIQADPAPVRLWVDN